MTENTHRCVICDSTKRQVLYRKDNYDEITTDDFMITKSLLKKGEVSKCVDCNFVYDTTGINYQRYYKDTLDEQYEADKDQRTKEFAIAFNVLNDYMGFFNEDKKILDIGCFTGVFLDYLKTTESARCKAYGIEPSKWAAEACRRKGLNVKESFFLDEYFKEGDFDTLTMFDVLEHTNQPVDFLLKANKILKRNGLLLITTPNIESLFHKIFKRNFWFIEIMHLFYFSPKTIKILLERAGFEVLTIRKHYKVLKLKYAISRLKSINRLLNGLQYLTKIPILRDLEIKFYAGQMLVIARRA